MAPFDLAHPSWFSQLEERTQLLAVDDRAFTAAFMSTADAPESIDRLRRSMHHLYVDAEVDYELGNNTGTELEREILLCPAVQAARHSVDFVLLQDADSHTRCARRPAS